MSKGRTERSSDWFEVNKESLAAEITRVRKSLDRHFFPASQEEHVSTPMSRPSELDAAPVSEETTLPKAHTLEFIRAAFRLTPFETDILLLTAGCALDARIAEIAASSTSRSITFGMALAALSNPHWSALTPDAPLRYWRLIDTGQGESITASPIRIDERILHFLVGMNHLDERLIGSVRPITESFLLPEIYSRRVDDICNAISNNPINSKMPVIELLGRDTELNRGIALETCRRLKVGLFAIQTAELSGNATERETFVRLWMREVLLTGAVLFFECAPYEEQVHLDRLKAYSRHLSGLQIISVDDPMILDNRPALRFEVKALSPKEQTVFWQTALGPLGARLNGQMDPVISKFRLSTSEIYSVSQEVSARVYAASPAGEGEDEALHNLLLDACRAQARPHLEELAKRIEVTSTFDDLVLPDTQIKILREIETHVRCQTQVYETWGFAKKSNRGLGITALFHGQSGTGKTLAAEVLANALHLDLFRIDLSTVVSKYIGETEKNLRRVFDAAETGGAILLFDEADALFGKRSEVKDSHDRYANIEVSYLLQRMEAYRGLAILTTNLKSALDTAFLRRIRFVVQFPFPDLHQRFEIWNRIFPTQTPTLALDMRKLARLNLAGGNIRNIALNAAFHAANRGGAVEMEDVIAAADTECLKIEKPLSTVELRKLQ